jgi:hypothetical protein
MEQANEIPLKLTAWVQEAVAPLVLALDELGEDVVTLDSSQGGPDRPARVVFKRRQGDNAALAQRIADALHGHDREVACELREAWQTGEVDPVLELACPDAHVMPVALILRAATRQGGPRRRDGRVGRRSAAQPGARDARKRALAAV